MDVLKKLLNLIEKSNNNGIASEIKWEGWRKNLAMDKAESQAGLGIGVPTG